MGVEFIASNQDVDVNFSWELDDLWKEVGAQNPEQNNKLPEIEDNNYKIESKNRKRKQEKWEIWNSEKQVFEERWITFKFNPEWDIREYVLWVPDNLKWQQIFKKSALTRLNLWDKIPPNNDEFTKIVSREQWKDMNEKYKNFRKNNLEGKCAWRWFSVYTFHRVNYVSSMWLGDKHTMSCNKDSWFLYSLSSDDELFCSVRLLKK